MAGVREKDLRRLSGGFKRTSKCCAFISENSRHARATAKA